MFVLKQVKSSIVECVLLVKGFNEFTECSAGRLLIDLRVAELFLDFFCPFGLISLHFRLHDCI